MNRVILLSVVLGALLAGCTSAKQIAERNEERCQARGLQPKTDAYQDCIVQLENERDQRVEARRRDMIEQSAAPSMNRGY